MYSLMMECFYPSYSFQNSWLILYTRKWINSNLSIRIYLSLNLPWQPVSVPIKPNVLSLVCVRPSYARTGAGFLIISGVSGMVAIMSPPVVFLAPIVVRHTERLLGRNRGREVQMDIQDIMEGSKDQFLYHYHYHYLFNN